MKIVFNNENLRFRIDVKDKDGNVVVDPSDVKKLRVTFKNEQKGDVWLDYRYPKEDGFPEVVLENGQFYIDITTEQAEKAAVGNKIVSVNYKVTDTNFPEGFNSFTEKGVIFLMKEA